ncbi:hypothetical protein FBY03_101233 [Pseudomonas sp. SJZ079]|uniref:hypothetical protein n=1 Tax=Pseudomonas sp. SJZ079 TaxID=2572887 RepID=UPI00119A2673|nr:hypothetical protein [Pseudomonas sp. SJZ079]TWC43040.1 hypothetical protein FBY03_101233 [Pseudomonas sp. SJZ079]
METPNLTEEQKIKLKILEPALRAAADRRDYEDAKKITLAIQNVLRPTGHETRLMHAKNYLFEIALEVGKVDIAITGFIGVRQKSGKNTRLYLEATTLLAICHLRKKDIDSAKPYMAEAFKYEKNITSPSKRSEYKIGLARRFDEEALLSSLATDANYKFNIEQIQKDAGELIRTKHEEEILELLGATAPESALDFVKEVHRESTKLLSHEDKLRLPSPASFEQKKNIGKGILSAFQSVIWKSLCDKDSEVYKMWFTNGMQAVLDKKYLTIAITGTLSGLSICIYGVAVYITALLIKIGIEVFCETYTPQSIMKMRK